jgi:hypothetical protein
MKMQHWSFFNPLTVTLWSSLPLNHLSPIKGLLSQCIVRISILHPETAFRHVSTGCHLSGCLSDEMRIFELRNIQIRCLSWKFH